VGSPGAGAAPYEWFRFSGTGEGTAGATGAPHALLVLWVDEDAVEDGRWMESSDSRAARSGIGPMRAGLESGRTAQGRGCRSRPARENLHQARRTLKPKAAAGRTEVNPGDMKFEL